MKSAALFILTLFTPLFAQAVTFKAGVENTQWQLEPSIYGCKFKQPIPFYGFGTFFKEAGEDLIFYLETNYNQMKTGQAALVIEAPGWRSNSLTSDLGFVEVKNTKLPIKVESIRSDRMMAELDAGMAPTFTRNAIYESDQIRVQLSPSKFRLYYNDYLACIAGLLPVNYNQVKANSLPFDVGQNLLDIQHKQQLELIATYVLADPLVSGIYIDGHTDSNGTRYHNRRLSEMRVAQTIEYLVVLDVNPDMITSRYHGERYPIASNETPGGQATNRRVTIRLERIENQPGDPLAKHPVF